MSTLQKAIEIAVRAHKKQEDKAGSPYILHPLRVMMACEREEEKIAAVLHDVVEDSPVTLEELKEEGFSKIITEAVDCLTIRDGESYNDFIMPAAFDPIARKVKLRDIEDNMNTLRIENITEKDLKRIQKYHEAHKKITHIDTITNTVTAGDFRERGELGQLCVRIFLIPKGVPFAGRVLTSGSAVIHFIVWSSYSEQVPAERFEQVRNALIEGDAASLYSMNRNWRPCYCPECGVNYSREKWIRHFLNDSYSVLEGTCPAGHKRILED